MWESVTKANTQYVAEGTRTEAPKFLTYVPTTTCAGMTTSNPAEVIHLYEGQFLCGKQSKTS